MTASLQSAKDFYKYQYPEDLTEDQKSAMDKITPLIKKVKDLGIEIHKTNNEIVNKLNDLGITRTTYELYIANLYKQDLNKKAKETQIYFEKLAEKHDPNTKKSTITKIKNYILSLIWK